MSLAAEVVILAEDVRHRKLIQRHLNKRGYKGRIRVETWVDKGYTTPCLKFVLEQYPFQVETLRGNLTRRSGALVVVADADDLTVEGRIESLEARLAASGQERSGTNETIAIVVPRRNVETWVFFLAGNAVDEETNYKARCRNFDNGEFATNFAAYTWPRRPLPEDCPPALRHACEVELSRLP